MQHNHQTRAHNTRPAAYIKPVALLLYIAAMLLFRR
jgi:hypothetical protein